MSKDISSIIKAVKDLHRYLKGADFVDFCTINEAARRGPIPAYRLRQLQKAGKLDGFFSGSRFYVDFDALQDRLKEESRRNGGQTA